MCVGGGTEVWNRAYSEAEPRAGLAVWKVISQLEAGEFCLAPNTSEMVPEKKLLLAFVTADFRQAPCAPVSPEFQLAKLVGIKVNLNLQVDGGGAGDGKVASQEERAGVGKWVDRLGMFSDFGASFSLLRAL